jgi:PBP1b-binding outer membrane lipoprotein LpoB
MKKIIFILLLAVSVVSCEKETAEQRQVITEPIAEITKTTKVFAGSNPSVKIDYTLTNTVNVQSIKLNNVLDVVVKDGNGVLYDHQGGGNWFANYWFIFFMKDGKQITTAVKTYYF